MPRRNARSSNQRVCISICGGSSCCCHGAKVRHNCYRYVCVCACVCVCVCVCVFVSASAAVHRAVAREPQFDMIVTGMCVCMCACVYV